jgi:hypothetical protein
MCLTFFKLLRQITGNSINNCAFLKSVIFVRDGHCDYSFQTPKNLATQLCIVTAEQNICSSFFCYEDIIFMYNLIKFVQKVFPTLNMSESLPISLALDTATSG